MVESVLPGDLSEADHNSSDSGVLTRDRILETALEIIDHDGVGGLSMHRLGKALERNPMALYRHAPNKAALLDGVAEKILEQLVVDTDDRDWTSQLRSVARSYRRLATYTSARSFAARNQTPGYPVGKAAFGDTASTRRHFETTRRIGLHSEQRLHVYRALFGFLHGHVLDKVQELVEQPDETDDALRLGLHRLPIGEFPLVRLPKTSW